MINCDIMRHIHVHLCLRALRFFNRELPLILGFGTLLLLSPLSEMFAKVSFTSSVHAQSPTLAPDVETLRRTLDQHKEFELLLRNEHEEIRNRYDTARNLIDRLRAAKDNDEEDIKLSKEERREIVSGLSRDPAHTNSNPIPSTLLPLSQQRPQKMQTEWQRALTGSADDFMKQSEQIRIAIRAINTEKAFIQNQLNELTGVYEALSPEEVLPALPEKAGLVRKNNEEAKKRQEEFERAQVKQDAAPTTDPTKQAPAEQAKPEPAEKSSADPAKQVTSAKPPETLAEAHALMQLMADALATWKPSANDVVPPQFPPGVMEKANKLFSEQHKKAQSKQSAKRVEGCATAEELCNRFNGEEKASCLSNNVVNDYAKACMTPSTSRNCSARCERVRQTILASAYLRQRGMAVLKASVPAETVLITTRLQIITTRITAIDRQMLDLAAKIKRRTIYLYENRNSGALIQHAGNYFDPAPPLVHVGEIPGQPNNADKQRENDLKAERAALQREYDELFEKQKRFSKWFDQARQYWLLDGLEAQCVPANAGLYYGDCMAQCTGNVDGHNFGSRASCGGGFALTWRSDLARRWLYAP